MGKGDAATCVPVLSAKCSAKCPCRAILEGSERFVYLVTQNFAQNTNCCLTQTHTMPYNTNFDPDPTFSLITLQTPFAILVHAFESRGLAPSRSGRQRRAEDAFDVPNIHGLIYFTFRSLENAPFC